MREIPDCLNRRYKVLNDLIEDITTAMPACMGGPGGCGSSGCGSGGGGTGGECSSSAMAPPCGEHNDEESEVGIKLMCDFWKILQDDPDFNLTQAVQQRMCIETCTGKCNIANLEKKPCCAPSSTGGGVSTRSGGSASASSRGSSGGYGKKVKPTTTRDSSTRRTKVHDCGVPKREPLRKVLGNLKQAASYEKKCNNRVSDLISAQKDLTEQIISLEEKEKKGVVLMKKADCMWSCMEDTYKRKIAASQERYQKLQKELREVEASVSKWRKNKKDLEFQIKNVNKCSQDLNEKTIQKENDIKVMELEIEGFRNRIASNAKDLNAAKNSYTSKKNASDARLAKIGEEIAKIKNKIGYECKCKTDKENEGSSFVKQAREELQKACRDLLQKKLENEDLRAEKEALLQEIGLLKNTYDTCAERCARRENNIAEETKRIDNEISGFSAKCVKCNKTTDCAGVLGCCVDCPRCTIERECLTDGDHCNADHTNECVCTRVKEKFLDNVFENMYTVLERQVKTCPGKEMADCIFTCLKRSRNGKLDPATRKILQQFILSTVKQNLNLTIVGGAVKTRCEMDPDTYSQLMLCLKDVAVTSPVKEDKATVSKKPPCDHWLSNGECNCPQGPKGCVCSKKAPKPPTHPGTCGHIVTEEDRVVEPSVKICPNETAACGVDCGMVGLPGAAEWRREPCASRTCPISPNMRAAQCVLGPEALADVRAAPPTPPPVRAAPPTPPVVPPLPPCHAPCQKATCISGSKAVKSCHTATKQVKGDLKDNLNKGTTANYQTATNENIQLTLSLSDAASAKVSLKPISSLQKAILCTDEQQEKILDQLIKNNLNQNDTNERFQINFKNKNGQSTNHQFTELTQTPSGKLAIELDEQTIKIIEEKSITDPYLFMSIKTSSSGHVLVDFDTKENVTDNSHSVTVRRTPSGTKLLDIHKHMIRNLKETLSKKKSNAGVSRSIKLPSTPKRSESPIDVDTELPQLLMSDKELILKGSMGTTYSDPDLPLKDITGPKTTDHLEHISGPILTEIYMKNEKRKNQKCTCPKTTPESDSSKLKSDTGLMPKNKKKDTLACSCNKSNSSSVSCRITRELDSPQELLIGTWKLSTSRSVDKCNYASELQQLYLQGNANVTVQIEVKNGIFQKLPAVITKTISGTIAIYARGMLSLQGISFDGKECPVLLSKTVSGTYFVRIGSNYQNFNATLIKTSSKGILLIPQSFQKRHRNGHEDIFIVKLCVMRNQLFEIPAVLKPTSSNNYLVVLDKEFETCYKESLKEYFGDNLEGCVNLHITNSGNYVLDFGSQDKSNFGKKSALLVQTSSGHIKVLVHGPEFEALVKKKLSIHSTSSAHASAQINSKLSASSIEFHTDNLTKSKNLDNQSCSKTQSFGKMKQKLQDNLPLPFEPSTVFTKTPSGQYAVLLHEESKRSLLNNLQNNSLISNTEGLVSIKQLDSGEIIIYLSNKDERKVHHGTLKVTPSGHFYVLVDEEVMKDLTGSSTKNERSIHNSAIGKRSIHAAQLIDSVHKSVATNFQAKLDVCSCDPSKCVCVDRLLDTTDGSNDKLSQLCPCVWKDISAGGVPIPSTSKDESSCDAKARKDEFESTEQCFCWLDSSHPQNKRSVGLSNKLKRKSVFCQADKEELEKKIKLGANSEDPAGQDVGKVWDSLDYLPPQLPHFLKDVRYR